MKYEIFDGRKTSLLEPDKVVEANSARKALQKYLDGRGEGHIKFYNSADRTVIWRTLPFIEEDGGKYQRGRISWWAIKSTPINPTPPPLLRD